MARWRARNGERRRYRRPSPRRVHQRAHGHRCCRAGRIASGDLVALRLVVSATHTGNLLGVPATDRRIQWDAVDIYRVTDDRRISEQWAFEDLAAILSQAGAISLPWAS